MKSLFSRRTTIAAIDMFEGKYHADLTAFITELGPEVYTQIRSEPISLKNRLSDLKRYIDANPAVLVEGEPLANVIVERAVSFLPGEPKHSFSRAPRLTPIMETFIRVLDLDGYAVSDGMLRRT
jgi:hypothetical protein